MILLAFALVAIFADQLAPVRAGSRTSSASRASRPVADPASTCWAVRRSARSTGSASTATRRDLYTRVVYGTRISLVIGFLTVGVAILIGAFLGAIAGFLGGRVDTLIMRLMDVLLVFPALHAGHRHRDRRSARASSTPRLPSGSWRSRSIARIMRASILTTREQDFVIASRALGESQQGLLFRRVLPNSLTPILVAGTLGIGTAVLDIAALSFLGLGADPRTPEWGAMIGARATACSRRPTCCSSRASR